MRHHVLLGACLFADRTPASGPGGHRPRRCSQTTSSSSRRARGSRRSHGQTAISAPSPGAGERPFRLNPGGGDPRLGEPRRRAVSYEHASTRRPLRRKLRREEPSDQAGPARILPPAIHPAQTMPIYGPLEVPEGSDEGPPDGLTLDMAIERLAQVNYGLRTKFQEIPKAQADILSAGLRANPLVFASADGVPYGSYSPRRPGENGYSVVLIQPIDVNRKRLVRVHVAEQAKHGPRGSIPGRRSA